MVIDLGVVREAPGAVGGSPRGLRGWRWYAVFGAVAVVLAAGAAEPVRGPLVEATVTAAVRYAFSGPDGVYLVDNATIRKYEVPGGEVGWQVSLPADGLAQGAFLVGGMVLVTGDGLESRTVALDGETGELRWRRPGTPIRTADSGLVLLTHQRPGDLRVRYEAVDVTTGAVRWELTDRDGLPAFYGHDRLVRWSPPDQVEVRDLRTGGVVSTAVMPLSGEDVMPSNGESGVQVVGGLMLVARDRGGQAVTDAYDLDRLVRRWTADLDLRSVHLSDCGDVLCVGSSGMDGVRVMEAATGRVRWSDSGPGVLWRTGSVIVSYGISEHPPRIRILDPEDGHLRADLGRWDIGPVDDSGLTLAVRPDPRAGAWIAELDLTQGKVKILRVTRDAFVCQPGGTVVVCSRPGGTSGIWYPRRSSDR